MERLDRGTLDFGILIQPVDISRYESLPLPVKDTWGLILRKDHPLAKKKAVRPADFADLPILLPKRLFRNEKLTGPIVEWFGEWGFKIIHTLKMQIYLGAKY